MPLRQMQIFYRIRSLDFFLGKASCQEQPFRDIVEPLIGSLMPIGSHDSDVLHRFFLQLAHLNSPISCCTHCPVLTRLFIFTPYPILYICHSNCHSRLPMVLHLLHLYSTFNMLTMGFGVGKFLCILSWSSQNSNICHLSHNRNKETED